MLTRLYLILEAPSETSAVEAFPTHLHLPPWPLKRFELCVKRCQSRPDDERAESVAFLGPFLRRCPELAVLVLKDVGYNCFPKEMATIIASAPLGQLQSLEIQGSPNESTRLGFYEELFKGNWPVLQNLEFKHGSYIVVPLIASKTWVTHLKSLHWNDSYTANPANADQLHLLLKSLQKGAIEKLTHSGLDFSMILDGFRGIKLDHLKFLSLAPWILDQVEGDEGVDVTDFMNVLFDSCIFPKIEILEIDCFNYYEDYPDYMPRWIRPPNCRVSRLVTVFPRLQEISLYALNLSETVAEYLGHVRRQTGCELKIRKKYSECYIPEIPPSPHRQQLLKLLEIDVKKWKKFCLDQVSTKFHDDCMYWDLLSDIHFKRIACGAALINCTSLEKLEKFVTFCEAEEDGGVMTTEALELLKTVMEKMILLRNEYGIEQQLKWGNTGTLIDLGPDV